MGPETPCDTLDEISPLTSASLGVPTCNVGAELHLPCLAAGFGHCSNTIRVAVEERPASLPSVLDRILCNRHFAFSMDSLCRERMRVTPAEARTRCMPFSCSSFEGLCKEPGLRVVKQVGTEPLNGGKSAVSTSCGVFFLW